MSKKITPPHEISVIVPINPFVANKYKGKDSCVCVFDVEKLIKWWPGQPHYPKKHAMKVKAIQRSLDWKRVAQIAAYLLQEEIVDAKEKIEKYFSHIYEPKKLEPGREWPPKLKRVIGFIPSEYPVFSSILVHINGADLNKQLFNGLTIGQLIFDENSSDLEFSIIDGQHRINGAYLALMLKKEVDPKAKWEIPAEVFLNLDPPDKSSIQAQIFIDINSNQKKVDKSLVEDLFPTARGEREPLTNKERAQEIGRRLMLEKGPLVGMIQIPGIKYGYKEVVTLSTLNGAIEDYLDLLKLNDIDSLEVQTDFFAQQIEEEIFEIFTFLDLIKKQI